MHDAVERRLVREVALNQFNVVHQRFNAVELFYAAAPDDSEDLVTFAEQKLRQVRSILSSDASNQRAHFLSFLIEPLKFAIAVA